MRACHSRMLDSEGCAAVINSGGFLDIMANSLVNRFCAAGVAMAEQRAQRRDMQGGCLYYE